MKKQFKNEVLLHGYGLVVRILIHAVEQFGFLRLKLRGLQNSVSNAEAVSRATPHQ